MLMLEISLDNVLAWLHELQSWSAVVKAERFHRVGTVKE